MSSPSRTMTRRSAASASWRPGSRRCGGTTPTSSPGSATTLSTEADPRDQALRDFADNRPLAHRVIFEGQRHSNKTPPFHSELITDFHSLTPFLCDIVFRGGGKSTRAEEATAIMAALREFFHGFIVGASLEKACERLHAIRRIIEKNEIYNHTFGDLQIGRASCRERV